MSRRWMVILGLLFGVALLRIADPFPQQRETALVNVTRAVATPRLAAASASTPGPHAASTLTWPPRERIDSEPIDVFAAPVPPPPPTSRT